jgi:predicted patatin/cPLA2 family phospholipase
MKTGLILEGGAMRGMFSCGVTDVLMEHGVRFDGAAGISAGAVFGCNYKSGQIGRAIRYNKKYCNDWRYCSFRSLFLTGDLYGVEFCYHRLPTELDPFDQAAFIADPMEFYVGTTSCSTGEIVFHKCYDCGPEDLLWMQGSASMPGVSRPVRIGDDCYLDGGVSCPVPYAFLDAQGYDRNVYVLTQPRGYRKEKTKGLAYLRMALRKYPKIMEDLERRHLCYNRQMEEIDAREAAGEILVIRPPEALGISRTEKDPEELERVYQMGRQEAERRLAEIKAFLAR